MDRLLFVSMNGTKAAMHHMELIANNLANANSIGFRADAALDTPVRIDGTGDQTRIYPRVDNQFTNFTQGPSIATGRDLDVAINGDGFFAVQSKTGQEAYTRAGNFQITQDGVLKTATGETVIGNGGVITIPQAEKIVISGDGTVSAKVAGSSDLSPIDRIKLVNPDIKSVTKGKDGLFYTAAGAAADDNVSLLSGSIEGSNVNVIQAMTEMIDLSRLYEMQTRFMKTASENGMKENSLLSTT